ncbi:MFS transporter [Escherichia coli]
MTVNHLHKSSGFAVFVAILPVLTAVLVGFIIIGVALPVLPLHVKNDLGFGTFMVGLVAGVQFAASLISRIWSGAYSDKQGAKKGVIAGLIAASMAGLLYLVSSWLVTLPGLSVFVLLTGRAILGGAESFIVTGGVAWGLVLVEKEHAGKVIAWVGTAMFASMALGGPIGTLLFGSFGFVSIALLTLILPLLVLAWLSRMEWDLVFTLAQAGDEGNDSTKAWPADRKTINAGTLVLNKAVPQQEGPCNDINYDPLILPDGIAASDDPILNARSSAYAKSYNLRTQEQAQQAGEHL